MRNSPGFKEKGEYNPAYEPKGMQEIKLKAFVNLHLNICPLIYPGFGIVFIIDL